MSIRQDCTIPRPTAIRTSRSFRRVGGSSLPSGQGGETEDEKLSDDFATQFNQALANVETVLKAANAKMSDVAKINLLIVNHDKERFRVMTQEVERVWGDNKAAMTLIPVPALALERMLVEIAVIAVVPA
ncbi:MAG: RidA family protein [Beggiatoa sp.]|nr:RidA family protein [Beggiatoa sp.]